MRRFENLKGELSQPKSQDPRPKSQAQDLSPKTQDLSPGLLRMKADIIFQLANNDLKHNH